MGRSADVLCVVRWQGRAYSVFLRDRHGVLEESKTAVLQRVVWFTERKVIAVRLIAANPFPIGFG